MSELNFTVIIIAFLVWLLMHILNALLFKPLLKCMNERKYYIEGVRKEAEDILKKAQELLEDYKKRIDKAKMEAYDLIKERRMLLLEEKEKILKKAKEEANLLINKALKAIEEDIKKAKMEIEKESYNLALLISKQLLKRETGSDEISKEQIN